MLMYLLGGTAEMVFNIVVDVNTTNFKKLEKRVR